MLQKAYEKDSQIKNKREKVNRGYVLHPKEKFCFDPLLRFEGWPTWAEIAENRKNAEQRPALTIFHWIAFSGPRPRPTRCRTWDERSLTQDLIMTLPLTPPKCSWNALGSQGWTRTPGLCRLFPAEPASNEGNTSFSFHRCLAILFSKGNTTVLEIHESV